MATGSSRTASATFTTGPVQPTHVSGNRSLDEFGVPEDAEEAAPPAGDDVEAAGSTDPGPSDEPGSDPATALGTADATPDPPDSTYVWRPEGGACAACGERVEERWRDADGLVCADCKEW